MIGCCNLASGVAGLQRTLERRRLPRGKCASWARARDFSDTVVPGRATHREFVVGRDAFTNGRFGLCNAIGAVYNAIGANPRLVITVLHRAIFQKIERSAANTTVTLKYASRSTIYL